MSAFRAVVFENEAFRELVGFSRGGAGEDVGGNPAVLAQLAQPKRGVAAGGRRAKGPIQGVTASHALNYDGLELPFWPAPPKK